MYPEVGAGGFTRVDGSVQFYARVQSLLGELGSDPVVLDFGAGRGLWASSPVAIHRRLLDLRLLAGRVIGVDVDDAVRDNPLLDEVHVLAPGEPLPFASGSIDLIVSDHTFEHVADAEAVASELRRVLRPGGWICARTPNKWGYIAVAARLVPNRLHRRVLHRVQPDRRDCDVFPTAYLLNTRRALRTHFPADEFRHIVYGWEAEPAYGAGSRAMVALLRLLGRCTPEALRPTWLIFLQRGNGPRGGPMPS
jgi:SAM-dependent methyltransferase